MTMGQQINSLRYYKGRIIFMIWIGSKICRWEESEYEAL